MKLKAALCQFDMAWQDWRENLARAERLIASSDADLIVLPEMFATGFVTDPAPVAQPVSGEIVQWMQQTARTKNAALAGSVIIREDGNCFNRMLFVQPNGAITHSDKRHLFAMGGEEGCFSRGDRRTVIEYKGFRFLLQVCYDLRFPVWSRRVPDSSDPAALDYDAILYAASWPESRRDVWRTLLRARAIENQTYVLGANRTGDDPRLHYVGDSAVIGFKGETLAEAGPEQILISATLDLDELHAFRKKFPVWRDADPFELK